MLVTLEGPDGAGKSTLVRDLRRDLGRRFTVIQSSRPPSSAEEVHREVHWRLQVPENMPVIADRDPRISEPIYGPILRGHSFLDLPSTPLRGFGLIVYCRPSLAAIQTFSRREAQLEGVHERLARIVLAYDELLANNCHVRYDWQVPDSYERVRTEILHYWEMTRWTD